MISYLGLPDIRQNFKVKKRAPGYFFPPRGEQPLISEPYRISSFALGLYHKGKVKLRADLKDYEINEKEIVFLAPQVIREWAFSEHSPVNSALFFSKDYMVKQLGSTHFAKSLRFFERESIFHLTLKEPEYNRLAEVFSGIFNTGQGASHHQERLIAHELMVLLLKIDELYHSELGSDKRKPNRAQQLTFQFKALLSHHFTTQRNVAFYAGKLALTSKHLSETLKKETGKSAGELIVERVILEAKVLLQDFEMSAAQVAFALSFSNASQFGKYFKTYTGMSPGTYRKKLG